MKIGTGRMECGGREYWEKSLEFGGICGVIRKPSAMDAPWNLAKTPSNWEHRA